jgi:mannosyltransferase OCH1-like enzyme
MNTWKNKNPDFEYILWTEEEFVKRNFKFQCSEQIETIKEIAGKADIIRLELLYHYGGVFLDADSICIEPLDDHLMEQKAFCAYENEEKRPGLVANGTIAFPPKHPLCRDAIHWILDKRNLKSIQTNHAWTTVGPTLLTNLLPKFKDVTIFPSYYFIPIHFTGVSYSGHGKVYAYQEWGSTKQNYDKMKFIKLPDSLKPPKESVSIVICSYNTKVTQLKECLESIANQNGHFGIELIWINNGSTNEATKQLEILLDKFNTTTRFCTIQYGKYKHKEDKECIHDGIHISTNKIVFTMDSDTILPPNKISKHLEKIKKR